MRLIERSRFPCSLPRAPLLCRMGDPRPALTSACAKNHLSPTVEDRIMPIVCRVRQSRLYRERSKSFTFVLRNAAKPPPVCVRVCARAQTIFFYPLIILFAAYLRRALEMTDGGLKIASTKVTGSIYVPVEFTLQIVSRFIQLRACGRLACFFAEIHIARQKCFFFFLCPYICIRRSLRLCHFCARLFARVKRSIYAEPSRPSETLGCRFVKLRRDVSLDSLSTVYSAHRAASCAKSIGFCSI